jgi:hypothetical protein
MYCSYTSLGAPAHATKSLAPSVIAVFWPVNDWCKENGPEIIRAFLTCHSRESGNPTLLMVLPLA